MAYFTYVLCSILHLRTTSGGSTEREWTIVSNNCGFWVFSCIIPNYIHSTSNSIHRARLGLRLGDIRESGETGDSGEEEDTQWRQVIT